MLRTIGSFGTGRNLCRVLLLFGARSAAGGCTGSVLLAVFFGFWVHEPLWRVDTLVAEARLHYGDGGSPGWRSLVKPRWQSAIDSKDPRQFERAYSESNQYLKQFI